MKAFQAPYLKDTKMVSKKTFYSSNFDVPRPIKNLNLSKLTKVS